MSKTNIISVSDDMIRSVHVWQRYLKVLSNWPLLQIDKSTIYGLQLIHYFIIIHTQVH